MKLFSNGDKTTQRFEVQSLLPGADQNLLSQSFDYQLEPYHKSLYAASLCSVLTESDLIDLNVNGFDRRIESDADTPLLWVLRDELQLFGTRFGCGAGLCGCCTVHVNGNAVRSCSVAVGDLRSATITTIEGLGSSAGMHPLQRSWLDLDVPQCGYCQAGQIMQAAALLFENPNPTDADIDEAMSGNLCRCGTYSRIRAAIKLAASRGHATSVGVPDEEAVPSKKDHSPGSTVPRVD